MTTNSVILSSDNKILTYKLKAIKTETSYILFINISRLFLLQAKFFMCTKIFLHIFFGLQVFVMPDTLLSNKRYIIINFIRPQKLSLG